MPYTLNDKLKDLKPYDPISGDYSIRLDANESFLELPIELLEMAQYAMADIAKALALTTALTPRL